jgi:hypothetical protein
MTAFEPSSIESTAADAIARWSLPSSPETLEPCVAHVVTVLDSASAPIATGATRMSSEYWRLDDVRFT